MLLLATYVVLGALLAGCTAPRYSATDRHTLFGHVVYSKLNIHARWCPGRFGGGRYEARLGNVVSGDAGSVVIPVNTPMTIEPIRRDCMRIAAHGGRAVFLGLGSGGPGMDRAEYLLYLAATTPVSFGGYTDTDLRGIREGRPLAGMSRAGVLAALGLPAPSFTSSLDQDTWAYSAQSGVSLAVQFDESGHVANTQEVTGQ